MTTPFTAGAIAFPLAPAAGARTLLRDADPALFFLLDYFAWSIRQYVGARLLAEANAAGIPWVDAVAGAAPFDPREYLLEHQAGFPLLGMYRVASAFSDLTVVKRQDVTQLELAYVLPPLSTAQRERLGPILHAVKALVAHRAEAGWDADYTPPGGSQGQQLFEQVTAGLTAMTATAARFGGYVDGELVFPSVVMTLEITEDAMLDESDLPPFRGRAYVDLEDGPTVVADDVLTLDRIAPATGPLAGGHTVTLHGDGLVPGTVVSFGNVAAAVDQHTGPQTMVLVVPPAPPHASTLPSLRVDITATTPAGITARLHAAYTYAD